MNKILPAVAFALMIGLVGGVNSPQEVQLQQGQIFENQDTRLNSVYATNQEGDFFGLIFGDDRAHFFGTVDSFEALEGENLQVCQHYLVRQDRLFQQDRTISEVYCSQLQRPGMIQQPPGLNQTDQNQTQQQQEQRDMGFADLFYAYDADMDYITYVISNQGEISNVVGSVEGIEQLDQESLTGCEYFFQAEAIAQGQDPSEVNCYSYEELQDRAEQGMLPYLDLEG